ncbi:TRAP transporter substrate-binding protein DctP [Desulfospira joergensenii]|uniref:TRAP transporter substrate-binding protein DctP n=1 Tax=Desulfospira joergensenii TaxID=53329 RepID=UPI0003B40C59|nr:TRAP transporter substrate-binding protein DctP [Desulfospira joergensenii]
MKKRILILMVSALIVTLAVGNAIAAKRWRIAGIAPVDHASTKILKAAAKEINGNTDNKFKLKVYPASQLGDYTLVLNEVAQGAIELADISITPQLDKQLGIVYIPSLAATYDDIDRVYAKGSNFYQIYEELLAKHNIKLLGIDVQGFAGVGMVKEPKSPKDINVAKDTMIRVPPIETWKIVAEALNYNTVTINWGDLYPAMQSGVCDGWIAGTPSWNYIAFKDLLKYYIPYNTTVDSTAYIMGMDKWNSLSAEEQKIFAAAFTTAAASSRENARKDDEGFISQMEDKGIKIIRLTEDETRTIAKEVHDKVWPKLTQTLGKDIMDRLDKDIQ